MRPLFERFRKEVQALDLCVAEEFLKHYVSYKAETNFVDVEAQAKRLKLWLNLQFHELPRPARPGQRCDRPRPLGNG